MTMTDTPNALNQEAQENQIDELAVLKQQAAMMGITHSNNITVETLRKKIADKMEEKPEVVESATNPLAAPAPAATESPVTPAAAPEAPVVVKTLTQRLKDEALKLVRIRISSMDPKKQDLDGEFITVANEFIGTVRKFVPFGEKTEKGYHVPQCILDHLRGREFLHVQTREVNGQIITKTRYVKEFAIEVMEPLTKAELKALAADQRATGRLDDDEE